MSRSNIALQVQALLEANRAPTFILDYIPHSIFLGLESLSPNVIKRAQYPYIIVDDGGAERIEEVEGEQTLIYHYFTLKVLIGTRAITDSKDSLTGAFNTTRDVSQVLKSDRFLGGLVNSALSITNITSGLFDTSQSGDGYFERRAVITIEYGICEDYTQTTNVTPLPPIPILTANRAVISDMNGALAVSSVSDIDLSYLQGATSNIQDQIDALSPSGSLVIPLRYRSIGTAINRYEEILRTGNRINQYIIWTSISKTIKLYEEIYTYTGNIMTSYIVKGYDNSGVLYKTDSHVLSYSGRRIISDEVAVA